MTKNGVKRREYLIPFAPVSLNQAYSTRVVKKGRGAIPIRYMQPAYKAFKEKVKECLAEADKKHGGKLDFEPPFAICFLFLMERSSFYFKNGKVRRRDVTDYFKLVEDACSEYWEVDDCQNFLVVGHKRWVPDGELDGFIEEAYKDPPHKNLRSVMRIVLTPLSEKFAEWDGKVVPDTTILEE